MPSRGHPTELLAGEVASWRGLQGNSAWYFLMSWLFRNFRSAETHHCVLRLRALPTHRTAYMSSSALSFTVLLAGMLGTRCRNRTRLFQQLSTAVTRGREWLGGHRKLREELFRYSHGCHYVCIWKIFLGSVATWALQFLLLFTARVWEKPQFPHGFRCFYFRGCSVPSPISGADLDSPSVAARSLSQMSSWLCSQVRLLKRLNGHFSPLCNIN